MMIERRVALPALLLAGALAIAGCNMRQDMAGPNGSEQKVDNAAMAEPVDTMPASSVPGAAPDNSQVEPRDQTVR